MLWLSISSSTMSRRAWRISGELVCTSIPSQTCGAARGQVVAHAFHVHHAHAARAGQAKIGMVAEPGDANPQLLGRRHNGCAGIDLDVNIVDFQGDFLFRGHWLNVLTSETVHVANLHFNGSPQRLIDCSGCPSRLK